MTKFLNNVDVKGYVSQTDVTSSLLKTDSNGKLVAAVAGTDYQTPTALASADRMVTVGRNATGVTLYKGTIVYISGSTGNRPNFVKAQANSEATSAGTFGVVYADIPNNSDGNVVNIGVIDTLDTRSNATNPFTTDTLADGDTLYLSPTNAGYVTNVKPSAPNHLVYIGKVTRTSPTNGTIVYRIQNGYELDEIHDVAISSLANNHTLVWESATNLWKNKTIAAALGYTPADDSLVLKLTGGTLTGDLTLSGTNPRLFFTDTDNNPDYFISNTDGTFTVYDVTNSVGRFKIYTTGNAEFNNNLTAASFIKSGGTSAQFLKADGSVDSSTYLTSITSSQVTTALGYTPYNSTNPSGYITSSALSSYLPLSGGTLTGALSGTSATFSSTNGYLNLDAINSGANEAGLFLKMGGTNVWEIYTAANDDALNFWRAGGGIKFKIATSGAATFSSSVQATQIGINTSLTTSHKLQIQGGADSGMIITNSSGATRILLSPSGAQHGEFALYNNSGNATTYLGANGGNNYLQAQGGNIGIGTTSPVGKLSTYGGEIGTQITFTKDAPSGAYGRLGQDSNGTFLTQNAKWDGTSWTRDNTGGVPMALALHNGNGRYEFRIASNGVNPISWTNALVIESNAAATFAGSLTTNGTFNFAATGNVSFTSNDANNYPRFTGNSASAQIGLFRASDGGMYIGGSANGFRVYDSSFNVRLLINQNGDTAFNSSTVTVGGNQILHAGNYTSYAVRWNSTSSYGSGLDNTTVIFNSVTLFDGYSAAVPGYPSGTNQWWVGALTIGDNNRGVQIAGGYADSDLYFRKGNTTWGTWRKVWTDANLTNLNQLTNGPGYITGYTETSTLANVTARGASTSTTLNLDGRVNIGNGLTRPSALNSDASAHARIGGADVHLYIASLGAGGGYKVAVQAARTSDFQSFDLDLQSNGGTLRYGGNEIATRAWVTSQAYITGYTETDTLATVTGRGASTSTNLSFTGILSFGSATRQMINVWGTQYGIGVQSSTQYFRSDSRFSWHRGGTHSDTQNDPGTGGAVAMTLDGSSNLTVAGYLRTAGITNNTVFWAAGAQNADFGNVLGQGTSSRSTMFRGNGTSTSVWWAGTDGLGNVIPFTAIDATSGEFTFWRNSGGVGGGDWTRIMTMNASGLTINSGAIIANVDSSGSSISAINNGNAGRWYGRITSFNSTSDKAVFVGTYASVAVVGAHNNALTAWANLYVNNVDGSNGGNVYLPTNSYVASNAIIHSGNIGSQSVTYATNSTRLYASDSPYTYGGAAPYYLYMNYDGGSYWELKVSPATPGTVRVAYANTSGTSGSATTAQRIETGNNQWTWSTGAHTATNPNSITLWDQYSTIGGSGSPETYGTILDIYGRSGHEHDQLMFGASGNILHRNCFYGTNTWNSWRTMLDSSNYSSYALPLSGGTMSGILYVARNLGSNDYTYVGQHNMHLQLKKASDGKKLELGVLDNGTGIIQANESGVGYYTLALNPVSGTVTINSATALHAGNYNSYSPTLTGGGASGTWGINVTGNANNITQYTINQNLGTGNSPTFNGLTLNGGISVVDGNVELYKSQTIDMSGGAYSTSNYYPVIIGVPTSGVTIQIQNNLNSNVPSWSTHGAGFSINLTWTTNGSGWGTTSVNRSILQWTERFANVQICGGITQMSTSSQEVVWLRGGGIYYFIYSRNISGFPSSTTYTNPYNTESAAVSSSVVNSPWSQSGGKMSYGELYSSGNVVASGAYTGNVSGSSYGSIKVSGTNGGYSGIYLSDASSTVVGMYDTGGNGGNWDSSTGWHFYWHRGNACLGLGGSTTSSSYRVYSNGNLYVSGFIYSTSYIQTSGAIYASADITAYYSDGRLKENVKVISSALDKLNKIGGYSYTANDLALELKAAVDKKVKLGVIAQEVKDVFPEVIEQAPFDRDPVTGESVSGENYMTVKYERFVPILIQAIKEQQVQIESLKSIIDDITK